MARERLTGGDQGSILPFTKEGVCAKFSTTPPSRLLSCLIKYPHTEYEGSTMEKLQDSLQESAKLGEDDLGRIFDSHRGPQTLDEEELVHVINLRGAIAVFVANYIGRVSIPSDIRRILTTVNQSENSREYNLRRMEFLAKIYEYLEDEHPEENTPIPIDERLEERVGSLYDKTATLVHFYNEKRPLKSDEEIAGMLHGPERNKYTYRNWVIHRILRILNPQEQLADW